jgi:2-polyprenyl-3-methyl-5-hydroxy-6-metoxy-1,4-benzoquinol methylase
MSCPVCLALKKKVLFRVPGAIVSSCTSCSHTFSHDLEVSPTEIYNDAYFQERHKNWFQHPNYPLFDKIKETILAVCKSKSTSILDVGCGNGDFLRYLQAHGFTHLTGLDLSKNAHEGIRFIQANLTTVKESDFTEKFDCIVTLATIEHLEDVRKFMGLLKSLTKPHAMVCIMTVDTSSPIYVLSRILKKMGVSYGVNRLYDKHHLNHFSKKSLQLLLETAGDCEILDRCGMNFPIEAVDLPRSFLKRVVQFIFFLTRKMGRGEFLQVVVLSLA